MTDYAAALSELFKKTMDIQLPKDIVTLSRSRCCDAEIVTGAALHYWSAWKRAKEALENGELGEREAGEDVGRTARKLACYYLQGPGSPECSNSTAPACIRCGRGSTGIRQRTYVLECRPGTAAYRRRAQEA